ncbi:LOW QUALITY PROTEIN: valacyclovir hydrolase-like [Gigantopelta aegis]|uniref:LOW QUALITY PROTEIN: valacyclovir hydrolase-like n=1 Tax=Gigantopelta aegis TaxID=1735272 RepID=UPI001B88E254|nr:LOW QUALITY PROTEIN: valacyclovir hydrolase-like [Gigantopelta aegis]
MFRRLLFSAVNIEVFCPGSLTNSPYRNVHLIRRHYTSKVTHGIQSHKVLVNGINLHYEKTGHGSHSILLLPGALGSSRTDFSPQLEGINRDQFTLFSFDPRGYGRSIPPERDWPLEFIQRDAQDAAALMKELGEQKYSVLGWSDGGITGMVLAARNPQVMKKLVIWGSNAYVTNKDMKIFKDIADISKWSERMRAPFINVYGETYFQTQWIKWIEAYNAYLTQRKGDICIEDVPRIQCPTFLLHGKKDAMVLQEHPDYLVKHIKNVRYYEFPDGKHNIHLHYAKEFNALVEEFLLQPMAKL